jgi:hypothetical protein
MKILNLLVMGLILTNGDVTLFNFDSPENSRDWQVVNDGVMGACQRVRFFTIRKVL